MVTVCGSGGPLGPAERSLRVQLKKPLSYRRLLRAFARHVGDAQERLTVVRSDGRPVDLDAIVEHEDLVVRVDVPVVGIVLWRDRERVAHALDKLEPVGARLRRAVDGADKAALQAALARHHVRLAPDYARTCTVGQLGCACSHMDVWRNLVDDGSRLCVVLEDDAEPVPRFRDRLDALLAEAADEAWDFIYLFFHPTAWTSHPIDGKTLVQGGFPTFGTVAYVVSHAGATSLLAAATGAPHDAPIDHLIMRLVQRGKLRTLASTTLLATTAGQLNPLQPPGRLGSNVWGSPALLGPPPQDPIH